MREGFYKIEYAGSAGFGAGVIVLDTNMVIGADAAGGEYDGSYVWNTEKQKFDVKITVKIPEGVQLVQGYVAPSGGTEFMVEFSLPRDAAGEIVQVETPLGKVALVITFIRAFPD